MSNAETLAKEVGMTDDGLCTATLAVPREAFVPDVAVAGPDGAGRYVIDRRERPEQWQCAVYSDVAVITQWDDEHSDPTKVDLYRDTPSSSLSAPGIALRFLEVLGAREHDRVLEIGTGTGYTAAVLSARVGEDNVTSVEVDPAVAERAKDNLKRAGYTPSVVVADGAAGWPADAPFDRVHVTVAVRDISGSWVAQARPGGVIVAPWQPGYDFGWIVALTATGTGAAHGRFHGRSGYMMLREQRAEMVFRTHHDDQAAVTSTRLDPRAIINGGEGAELIITGLVPNVKLIPIRHDDGAVSVSLYEIGRPEGAWATCDFEPGHAEFEVAQYGDRHLWDEVEAAFLRWLDLGSPGPDRFGLTVTAEGEHRVWVDEPGRVLPRDAP